MPHSIVGHAGRVSIHRRALGFQRFQVMGSLVEVSCGSADLRMFVQFLVQA